MTLKAPEPWPTPPWEVAVVVRYNNYDDARPERQVDLMRAFSNVDEAEAEAQRLNAVAVRQGQTTAYFVSILYQRAK